MAVRDYLNQSGTIRRFTDTATGDWGRTGKTWADLATSVKCRLQPSKGREIIFDAKTVVSTHLLFLAAAQDITEKDRFVLEGKTYDVLLVNRQQGFSGEHHVEAELLFVGGGVVD